MDDFVEEVIERYDESDYDSGYVQLNNDDEIDQNSLNIASGISNALAVDIMNCEGPGISYGEIAHINGLGKEELNALYEEANEYLKKEEDKEQYE